MPWTETVGQPSLPWSGRSAGAKGTSYRGAKDAEPRAGTQAARYYDWLKARGVHGATDAEANAALALGLNIINARRNALVTAGLVVDSGRERPGRTGVGNVVWIAVQFKGAAA